MHERPYQPGIDGLRAIAVLAVCIFHLNPRWLPGGFVGVDVFFVISGFLIGSGILADLQSGSFSLTGFYQRRIARLLGAFAFVLAVTLGAGVIVYSDQILGALGANTAAAAGSISNIKTLHAGDYFQLTNANQPLLHFWSLSVEEQFYFVFPVLIMVAYRFCGVRAKWGLWLAFGLSLAYSSYLTLFDPSSAFFLLPSRTWEMLAGVLLAAYPGMLLCASFAKRVETLYGGLVLITGPLITMSEGSRFPGALALIPVLGAAMLIAYSQRDASEHTVLSWPPLVAIGKASYSLYLWHWPVYCLTDYALYQHPAWVRMMVKLVLTPILAGFSYRFIEGPTRRRLRLPASRNLAFASMALSLSSIAGIGLWIRSEAYLDAGPIDIARGGRRINQTGTHGNMVLLGDSHSAVYGRVVREIASDLDLRLSLLDVPGGDPLPHSSGEVSPLWQQTSEIVKREHPDFLVLVCRWLVKLHGDEKRLKLAVSELKSSSRFLVLLTQPPELTETQGRAGFLKGLHPPFLELESIHQERLRANQMVTSVAGSNVFVIDVAPLFSNQLEVKFFDQSGQELYSDFTHLSQVGAHKVKAPLEQLIKSLQAKLFAENHAAALSAWSESR